MYRKRQNTFKERQDPDNPVAEELVDELDGIESWDRKKYSNNEQVEDYKFTALDVRNYLSEQYENGQEPHPEIQDKVEEGEYRWIERKLGEAEDQGLVSAEIGEVYGAVQTGGARPIFYSLGD